MIIYHHNHNHNYNYNHGDMHNSAGLSWSHDADYEDYRALPPEALVELVSGTRSDEDEDESN